MSWWSQKSVGMALKYLWICSLIILVLQGYSAYSMLPVKVATHFKMSGVPNGWSSKQEFFILLYSMIFGINALLLGFIIWLPRMMYGASARLLSIPNRDYWLATDERRAECGKIMRNMMYGTMILMNFMFGYIFHIIVQSNISARRPVSIWDIFVPLGPLLIFIGVYSLVAFRKAEE